MARNHNQPKPVPAKHSNRPSNSREAKPGRIEIRRLTLMSPTVMHPPCSGSAQPSRSAVALKPLVWYPIHIHSSPKSYCTLDSSLGFLFELDGRCRRVSVRSVVTMQLSVLLGDLRYGRCDIPLLLLPHDPSMLARLLALVQISVFTSLLPRKPILTEIPPSTTNRSSW